MPYVSAAKKAALAAWIDRTAKQVSKRTVPWGVRSCFDQDDAEVVSRLAMLQAAEKGHTDEALLYKIAKNAVFNGFRSVSGPLSLQNALSLESSIGVPGVNSLEATDGLPSESLQAMMTAEILDRLQSGRQRLVIKKLYLEGVSQRDCAAELGVSIPALKALRERALTNLRKIASMK